MYLEIPFPQGLSLKIGDASAGRNKFPTGHLQNGFLLVDRGYELAEEAVGFGVPVLQKGLQTIFPGAVKLSWAKSGSFTWQINAVFTLNLVEKITRDGNIDLENRLLYALKNGAAALIRGLPGLRSMLTATSSQLRRLFHLETTYAQAGFNITLAVRYTLDTLTGKIQVEIDTPGLPEDISAVMVMNEQGAHYFDHYHDSSGIEIHGEAIGCWDEVTARQAWFESKLHKVAFKLDQVKGARLFRGRELIGSRLAWAGFGYSFSPSLSTFHYEMIVERLA
jgi:hypothetical protein